MPTPPLRRGDCARTVPASPINPPKFTRIGKPKVEENPQNIEKMLDVVFLIPSPGQKFRNMAAGSQNDQKMGIQGVAFGGGGASAVAHPP